MVRNQESQQSINLDSRHAVLVSCARAIVRQDLLLAETLCLRTALGKKHLRIADQRVSLADPPAFEQLVIRTSFARQKHIVAELADNVSDPNSGLA